MSMPLYCEMTVGSATVRLNGTGGPSGDGLVVTREGVEGWFSTPDLKTGLSERGSGDGAHDVSDAGIAYSSRTVSVHCAAIGRTRNDALDSIDLLLSCAHRMVRLRCVDASSDTYVTGIAQVAVRTDWYERGILADVTVVCPRPERLSWRAQTRQLLAAYSSDGGLRYGDDALGLSYPLAYGYERTCPQNACTLTNAGSSRAYPVFTVHPPFSGELRLVCTGGGTQTEIRFQTEENALTPVVLDSRSRTATRGGVDVSRRLVSRGFPTVPAGGTLNVTLLAAGDGWVDVETRDTWM